MLFKIFFWLMARATKHDNQLKKNKASTNASNKCVYNTYIYTNVCLTHHKKQYGIKLVFGTVNVAKCAGNREPCLYGGSIRELIESTLFFCFNIHG